jgi:hypothetical protein
MSATWKAFRIVESMAFQRAAHTSEVLICPRNGRF